MVTATVAATIWDALAGVADPEIPAVSVVEMGMIKSVDFEGHTARIVVLPTFTGCPAVPIIERDVAVAAGSVPGVEEVEVSTTFTPPWTPSRITDEGRRKLAAFGLAPPEPGGPVLVTDIGLPKVAICPFCNSRETQNENPFGPTPCRALYYCRSCNQPFEQFKPI